MAMATDFDTAVSPPLESRQMPILHGMTQHALPSDHSYRHRQNLESILRRWSYEYNLPIEIDECSDRFIRLHGDLGARQTLQYSLQETGGGRVLVIENMVNDRYRQKGLMTLLQANLLQASRAEIIIFSDVGKKGQEFVQSMRKRKLIQDLRQIAPREPGKLEDIEARVDHKALETYLAGWR